MASGDAGLRAAFPRGRQTDGGFLSPRMVASCDPSPTVEEVLTGNLHQPHNSRRRVGFTTPRPEVSGALSDRATPQSCPSRWPTERGHVRCGGHRALPPDSGQAHREGPITSVPTQGEASCISSEPPRRKGTRTSCCLPSSLKTGSFAWLGGCGGQGHA